jgi:polar amino acid transport system substrate-binding protein
MFNTCIRFGRISLLLLAGFFSIDSHAEEKTLRWAADAKSGAPYMFVDAKDPTKMQGFEKEIIESLAQKMGRTLVTVQNEWESLVPGLERGDYDIAANGIEITPQREKIVDFSIPYYATFEQNISRADDYRMDGGLKSLDGKKVGTLKASLAHYILEKETKAKIVFYEQETSGYHDVEIGRLDSFFADYPIALYYALSNPKLKASGPPVGKMFYGIAVSKRNPELLREINQALGEMLVSGDIEKILAKWNLMHPFTVEAMGLKTKIENKQEELNKVASQQSKQLTFGDRMELYRKILPLLLKGALTSIEVSIVSMMLAITFGLLLALMRLYGNTGVAFFSQAIVEMLRGTPLLIQLYLIFFGLPYLGIHLTPFWAAVIGLGMNYGAYEAENYRAGIEAVPHTQLEAAQALALSPVQRFIYVLFPQAYRIILPPMTNDFISLIKDSSLVSVITMVELTTVYSQLASTYFDHLGLGILVAILYFLMGYPFVRIARRLEKKMKKKR